RRPRTYWKIRSAVEVREGDQFIGVYPAERYSVAYTINFPHPVIGLQTFELDLVGNSYMREIAPARTFGFLHDEQMLRNMGLIRGAASGNTIILSDDAIQNGPLRFKEEFVRHKILDLIGDVALLGHRILGRVVAHRAGHAMHTVLVSRLLRERSLTEPAYLEGETNSEESTTAAVLEQTV